MRWVNFFFSLDGRIGRKTFWLLTIAVLAVELIVGFVAALAVASLVGDADSPAVDRAMDITLLVFLYPQFVIDVKRGHDRDIPLGVIGGFYAVFATRDLLEDFDWLVRDPNQNLFSNANLASFVVTLLVGVAALVLLIELGFRKGTTGPNRYGPDPLGPRALPAHG